MKEYVEIGEIILISIVTIVVVIKKNVGRIKSLFGYPDEYTDNLELARKVSGQLGALRERLKAGRTYVARFHNGEYFADGGPLTKYTISYMDVDDRSGYPEWWPEHFKEIQTSHAQELLSPLFKNGRVSIAARSFKRDGYFYRTMISNGTTHIFAILISKNNYPTAWLGIEWTKGNPKPRIVDIEAAQECAIRIGNILNKRGD